MKKLSLAVLTLAISYSINALADTELARIEKNMGKTQSISLIASGESSGTSKLVVRTTMTDATFRESNITQFESTVREVLSRVDESSDPIVTKTRGLVCYNIPGPLPELLVNRIDRSGPTNTSQLVTVLTNVGCEFSIWSAPKSESGETSARILYRLLFDASK